MNNAIFFSIYSLAHQASFLDSFIIFCAKYLPYLLIIFLLIFFAYHYVGSFDFRRPFAVIVTKIKEILLVFIPATFSWIVSQIIKVLVQAPRPFVVFSDTVEPLFPHLGYSFPSAHAMFFGALAISLYFVHKKLGKFCIIITLIICLARIASGVHFPIDIFFGLIFGALVAFIFHRVFIKKYS